MLKGICSWVLPVAVGLLFFFPDVPLAQTPSFRQAPMLEKLVRRRLLPPLRDRLPSDPAVAKIEQNGGTLGRYGGEWRMLISRIKDVRMLTVYGYARLVGYNQKYDLEADILKSFEVEKGRIFTLHLRPGHRWSDGTPFTTEDFRYFWEDMANNSDLYPSGLPRDLLVEGRPPKVEFLDKTTVRYTWHAPNPYFLSGLARALPLGIFRPAHYLKKFHARYTPRKVLDGIIQTLRKRNWMGVHLKKDDFNNPDMPTLQPWVNTTPLPSERFVALRNPYFHRVDSRGWQLPYIDQVVLTLTDSRLMAARSGAGEVDLQARGLSFTDYTFLKKGEKRNNFSVTLWKEARGSHLALYPNLNVNDSQWRAVFRNVKFRRALSLAINRREINQVFYYGLCLEGANTVLPSSPLYKSHYRTAWSSFDPALANKLLDEMGLRRRPGEKIRRLPDNRPMEIIVETAGESSLHTDILGLIREDWQEIGVALFTRGSQRDLFRRRIFAGETQMSIWFGLTNGVATPQSDPWELAPVHQISLQWPKWGQYYETKKRAGEPISLPAARELMTAYRAWQTGQSSEQLRSAWERMLEINAQQVFSIGLVGAAKQPVIRNNALVNVPTVGIYNWEPGSHFGIYRPDTFWYRENGKGQRKSTASSD